MNSKTTALVLFFAVRSILCGQDLKQATALGPREIVSDTSFALKNGKKIYFRFIEKERYENQLSHYKRSILETAACKKIESFEDCEKRLANERLSKQKKFFETDSCIKIECGNGTILNLCDRPEVHYQLLDYLDSFTSYLYRAKYLNDTEHKLIDSKTCEVITIWGELAVSPDRERLIAHSFNAEKYRWRRLNGLQMWKREDETVRLEWYLHIENFGPIEVFWVDNSRLYLRTLPTVPSMRRSVETMTSSEDERFLEIILPIDL